MGRVLSLLTLGLATVAATGPGISDWSQLLNSCADTYCSSPDKVLRIFLFYLDVPNLLPRVFQDGLWLHLQINQYCMGTTVVTDMGATESDMSLNIENQESAGWPVLIVGATSAGVAVAGLAMGYLSGASFRR